MNLYGHNDENFMYFSSSYDGHDDDDNQDSADMKNTARLPTWLTESTPDEFVV